MKNHMKKSIAIIFLSLSICISANAGVRGTNPPPTYLGTMALFVQTALGLLGF
jgi:hypothetical protein